MDRPTVSAAAQTEYDRIAARLAGAGVMPCKMMGMPTLYVGGKAFVGLYGDAMVFKLEGADHAATLALSGAVLFDPSGMGRPMKAWVEVTLEHAAEWPSLADRAVEASRART